MTTQLQEVLDMIERDGQAGLRFVEDDGYFPTFVTRPEVSNGRTEDKRTPPYTLSDLSMMFACSSATARWLREALAKANATPDDVLLLAQKLSMEFPHPARVPFSALLEGVAIIRVHREEEDRKQRQEPGPAYYGVLALTQRFACSFTDAERLRAAFQAVNASETQIQYFASIAKTRSVDVLIKDIRSAKDLPEGNWTADQRQSILAHKAFVEREMSIQADHPVPRRDGRSNLNRYLRLFQAGIPTGQHRTVPSMMTARDRELFQESRGKGKMTAPHDQTMWIPGAKHLLPDNLKFQFGLTNQAATVLTEDLRSELAPVASEETAKHLNKQAALTANELAEILRDLFQMPGLDATPKMVAKWARELRETGKPVLEFILEMAPFAQGCRECEPSPEDALSQKNAIDSYYDGDRVMEAIEYEEEEAIYSLDPAGEELDPEESDETVVVASGEGSAAPAEATDENPLEVTEGQYESVGYHLVGLGDEEIDNYPEPADDPVYLRIKNTSPTSREFAVLGKELFPLGQREFVELDEQLKALRNDLRKAKAEMKDGRKKEKELRGLRDTIKHASARLHHLSYLHSLRWALYHLRKEMSALSDPEVQKWLGRIQTAKSWRNWFDETGRPHQGLAAIGNQLYEQTREMISGHRGLLIETYRKKKQAFLQEKGASAPTKSAAPAGAEQPAAAAAAPEIAIAA